MGEPGRLVVEDMGGYYRVIGIGEDEAKDFLRRGIGDLINGEFRVEPMELAYLVFTGTKVFMDNNELTFGDVIKGLKDMSALMIYLDMRRRGYYVKPVREGPIDFLVWEKGKSPINSNPRYMLKILTEGVGERVVDLVRLMRYSESMGSQLVLALVSSEGVVTYYKAFSFRSTRFERSLGD